MSADEPYRVGRNRPPIETRFQKGVCPNPNGRPKGARNIASLVHKTFAETIVVTTNGRRKTMTKLEAATVQIANKAAAGDLKAIQLAFSLSQEAEARLAAESAGTLSREERRASDQAILAVLGDRMRMCRDDQEDGEKSDG